MNIEKPLISRSQLERMMDRQAVIHRYTSSSMSLRGFARAEGIPYSTLRHIYKRGSADPMKLIDHRQRNGRKCAVDSQCMTWVLAYLAIHRQATVTGAWRALAPIAHEHGWSYPSYGQILRAISKLPTDLRDYMVHGSKHLFESWGLVQRKEIGESNAAWQIDATQLPIWCMDMESGEQFQPWAIGMMDAASRVVMGLRVFRGSPNTGDGLLTLRTAILPKQDERFPFFGIPKEIQSDNGQIFKSADFLDALLRLGIQHRPIPNDCPSANGKVERFFRTVQDQLCRGLETYAHQHRGLATAKAHPLPWPLVQKLVDRFVCEYHLRPHRSIDKSPWEAWHDGLGAAAGIVIKPSEVVDACKVRIEVTVGRDGVEMETGKFYSSPELAGLVRQRVVLRVLPEGGDATIDCFYRGELVGKLEPVNQNHELVEKIKTARLDRAKELARLRKTLIKEARRILPGNPETTGTRKPIVTPAPEDDVVLDVPKLSTEEENSE